VHVVQTDRTKFPPPKPDDHE